MHINKFFMKERALKKQTKNCELCKRIDNLSSIWKKK